MRSSPTCPRCGYDLSGQVATWHPAGADSSGACCPTSGLCSECGLTFSWGRLYTETVLAPRWFHETSRRPVLRFPGTVLRTLLPWHFWAHVTLETHVRLWRAAWVVLLVPLLAGLAVAMPEVVGRLLWNGIGAVWALVHETPLSDVFFSMTWWVMSPMLAPAAGATIAWPLMMLVLPHTRARAKVRPRHVARAACYGWGWMLVALCLSIAGGIVLPVLLFVLQSPRMRGWSSTPWVQELLTDLYWKLAWLRHDASPSLSWVGFVIAGFVCVFWWFVLRRGWRMDEARAAFLAGLVPVAIFAYAMEQAVEPLRMFVLGWY